MVRVYLEHLLEPRRGDVRLEEVLFLQAGDLEKEVDALALGGRDVELRLENAHEVRPLLEGLVDARQAAHRGQAGRVELEDLAVHLRRTRGVAEARLRRAATRSFVLAISAGSDSAGTFRARTSASSRFCPRAM